MTHERIENALRGEIPGDEHRHVARPIPATVDGARAELAAAPHMSHAVAYMAAAAALAIVAVVGWTAWRSVGAQDGGLGDGTASLGPSPSAAAAGPVACRAEDFAVASDPWDAGAGSRGTRIVFRVVQSTPSCLLPASVEASITDGSTVLVTGRSPAAASTEIQAGAQIELGISWSNWCGAPPSNPALFVDLGDDVIPVVPPEGGVLVPPCMGSGQPTALNVTGFQASERPPIDG